MDVKQIDTGVTVAILPVRRKYLRLSRGEPDASHRVLGSAACSSAQSSA